MADRDRNNWRGTVPTILTVVQQKHPDAEQQWTVMAFSTLLNEVPYCVRSTSTPPSSVAGAALGLAALENGPPDVAPGIVVGNAGIRSSNDDADAKLLDAGAAGTMPGATC